ncbi:glycosyltransferase family 4 protein [Flagellimonas hymeniacidonis]|nr:glycosyltransferase family 4 protein [Flagellimonas hymeniacidonis]
MKKKILIICSYDGSLITFRGDFIQDLVKEGYSVYAAAPEMSSKVNEKIKEFGASPLSFQLKRTGLSPFSDIRSMLQLKKIIQKHQIDIVFPYTIKPVIYGSMAANLSRTPVVSLITGLGFTFTGISLKARLLQSIAEFLYKISIQKNKLVIFQNKDDAELFRKRNILSNIQNTSVVNGSGVNLDRYSYRENTNTTGAVKFLFVARLIREKGIHLYIEAAKMLKSKFPMAEFHIIGAPDKSPSSINIKDLTHFHDNGVVIYHGRQNNVSYFLGKSDIFVLPTYYREGVPRSILEALSVGLPIITTDSPGCRETVVGSENGKLISPGSLEELVGAMQFFLENPSAIHQMGISSRELAEKKFDVKIINKEIISSLNLHL